MLRETLCLLGTLTAVQAWALTDQEIVDQYYPDRLVQKSTRIHAKLSKESSFVLVDLDNSGDKNYIVAAYSNGLRGAVRVLKKSGSSVALVSEPNLPGMTGSSPSITLIDLDGDKKPEIEVSFFSVRALRSDWYFKWVAPNLQFIGPSWTDEDGKVQTAVINSGAIDVDGDGVLEIIDGPQEPRPVDDEDSKPDLVEVYSLKNGKYTYATTFFFESLFVRKKGNPVTESRTFKVDQSNAQYVLKVVNGDADGKNRVSSAEIVLNGKAIATSSNFNQKTPTFTVPVTLKTDNELKVTLKSSPGSKLRVTVEAKR